MVGGTHLLARNPGWGAYPPSALLSIPIVPLRARETQSKFDCPPDELFHSDSERGENDSQEGEKNENTASVRARFRKGRNEKARRGF